MTKPKRLIPTIEEIQGHTIASARAEGYGLDALIPDAAIHDEVNEHDFEHGDGFGVHDAISYPSAEEERRLRLAVGHIAAALSIPQDDLRSIHLTPHVITAHAVRPDGLRTFVDGRVLR